MKEKLFHNFNLFLPEDSFHLHLHHIIVELIFKIVFLENQVSGKTTLFYSFAQGSPASRLYHYMTDRLVASLAVFLSQHWLRDHLISHILTQWSVNTASWHQKKKRTYLSKRLFYLQTRLALSTQRSRLCEWQDRFYHPWGTLTFARLIAAEWFTYKPAVPTASDLQRPVRVLVKEMLACTGVVTELNPPEKSFLCYQWRGSRYATAVSIVIFLRPVNQRGGQKRNCCIHSTVLSPIISSDRRASPIALINVRDAELGSSIGFVFEDERACARFCRAFTRSCCFGNVPLGGWIFMISD